MVDEKRSYRIGILMGLGNYSVRIALKLAYFYVQAALRAKLSKRLLIIIEIEQKNKP